jgi:hypothetical protein
MEIQILCQFFLILFGSFFAIQLIFNTKLFAQKSLRIYSKQAQGSLKPLGFLLLAMVLMLVVTLPMLQIGGFGSARELIAVIGIYTAITFIWNMGQYLKIFQTPDGREYYKKNTFRPLVVFLVTLIYFLAS